MRYALYSEYLLMMGGCSSMTNAHSETGQMAVCCQILALGAFRSRSVLSLLVGALFKNLSLLLNTPRVPKLILTQFVFDNGSFFEDLCIIKMRISVI
jgi:hypothetical protein